MSELVRVNPEHPCQPDGAHHPHAVVCVDSDCEGEGQPCGYEDRRCCVCDGPWPCRTKREHVEERRSPTEETKTDE